VHAELAGGLPQPDLAGELVGLLGQLPPLPQDTGLGEGVATGAGTGPSLLARLRRTLHLAPGAMTFGQVACPGSTGLRVSPEEVVPIGTPLAAEMQGVGF
jgi:hypothetical protein